MDDAYYYDEDDDQEANEERLMELSTLPFNEALASASELLGKEDTRLPAAFALLERLKLPAEGQEEAEELAVGGPKLLRLLGRYLGYHPAVLEQVLEALTLVERPGPIIESLPLLVVGAGPEEVARVVEALKEALHEDLGGLLLPVLGALFDLPLTPRLRREAVGLAQEALEVVPDADVPVVVRTLLRTMDEQSDPALLTQIRRECAGLSAQATAVLMEVLATALATNPKVARLFLLSIRTTTTDLSIVDAIVLVLLFPHPNHQAVVQDALLRFLASNTTTTATTAGTTSSSSHDGGGSGIASLLCRLAEFTAEAHWSSMATPLAELSQWLLLSSLLPPRPRLALALAPGREARALAAYLLRRLFQLHMGLRDEILGFLMTLCVPSLLQSNASTASGGFGEDLATSTNGGGSGGGSSSNIREEMRQRAVTLLPLMQASRSILEALAQETPELLIPYAGLLCDQLLNSASDLPAPVMGPLLRALTLLARTHAASGIEVTLIIYIQKQLWTATSAAATSGGGGRGGGGLLSGGGNGSGSSRMSWMMEEMAGAHDDQRKLASLVLAESLVLLGNAGGGRGKKQHLSLNGMEEEDEDQGKSQDLSAILTWVVRAVPVASPKVAAYGLRFLLRVLSSRRGAREETNAEERDNEEEEQENDDPRRSRRRRDGNGADGLTQQVEEVVIGLLSRLGLLVKQKELVEEDQERLSYLPQADRAAANTPTTVTLPWRGKKTTDTATLDHGKKRMPPPVTARGVMGILLQEADEEEEDELEEREDGEGQGRPATSSLAWIIEGLLDAYVPRMVGAEPLGLGPLLLVRTLVKALLTLQWDELDTAKDKAACFEKLAAAPILLPSWPSLRRKRGGSSAGAGVDMSREEGEEGWEEELGLWREGTLDKKGGSKKSNNNNKKKRSTGGASSSKKRRRVEDDEDEAVESDDGEGNEDEEEGGEEEEEEEEETHDVFRDRSGPKDHWLRAGWGALFAAMVTGPLIEAWLSGCKQQDSWAAKVPAPVVQILLRRHTDLLHRVRRCLERVCPGASTFSSSSSSRRNSWGGSGKAREVAAAMADEPLRITRSREELEKALAAYGDTATGPASLQTVLLGVLLGWTREALGKVVRVHGKEEEEEEEEEEEVLEERLTREEGTLMPLLGLLRSVLEGSLCRNQQAAVLEGLLVNNDDDDDGADDDDQGLDVHRQPVRLGDTKLTNLQQMMHQLGPLNRLLRLLRRCRHRHHPSLGSLLEPRDLSRLLCLYLAYTRRLCLRVAGQGHVGSSSSSSAVASASASASASSSSCPVPSAPPLQRPAGMGDIARLFSPPSSPHNEDTTTTEHEARESAYGFLVHQMERAEDEGVASCLLEVLSCFTVGTHKAGTAACFEALHCLETAYPVVDPDLTRPAGDGRGGPWCGGGIDNNNDSLQKKEGTSMLLPVALSQVLRPSLGVHEVQTRVLLDLHKAALSSSTPLAQRPVLRHFVLTFWSLLSREERSAGLLRLSEGIQAVFREQKEAEAEEGKERLRQRRHRAKWCSSRSAPPILTPYEAENGIRVLRALTPEAGPALLELLLLLSLATLLLARPQSVAATLPRATTQRRLKHRQQQEQEQEESLASPYEEVHLALVALTHIMLMVGKGTISSWAAPGRGSARLAAATVKTACLALSGLQWQIERCLAWRTARGGPKETETEEQEERERARQHETELGHVQKLVEDALAFTGVVTEMCQEMKRSSRSSSSTNSSSSSKAAKHKQASSKKKDTPGQEDSAQERWQGLTVNLSDRHFVPRCVLACEKLVEGLRETAAVLRLPIKIGNAAALTKRQQQQHQKKQKQKQTKKGEEEEEGGVRLMQVQTKTALLQWFKAAEERSEEEPSRGWARRGEEEAEFDDEEDEDDDEFFDAQEEIDLGSEEDEEEEEEEEEDEFYALVSGGGSGSGSRRWGNSATGGEEEEEEDDDQGPQRRRGSRPFSSTPKVVVGGGTTARVLESDGGTLVVQFGGASKRRRR